MAGNKKYRLALVLSVVMFLFSSAHTLQKKTGKDHSPPTVLLSIPAPTGKNGWYNQPVHVLVRAWDGGSGVKNVQVSLGGGTWYKQSLTIRKDGTYMIIGKAIDKAGNTATASQIIQVDMTAPEVTFEVPKSDGGLGWYLGSVSVSLTGSDELSGVYKTDLIAQGNFEPSERSLLDIQEIYRPVSKQQNSQYIVLGDSPSEDAANIKLSQSGKYLVSGYVEDMAGNRTPVETDLLIDLTAPQISINPPDQYFGEIELSGSLLDYESSVKQVWVDNGDGWQTVDFDQSTWQATWQTEDLKDDEYIIQAKVMDFAGNVTSTSSSVTVVNNLWPVLALCGVLLGLGLVALYDPRRRAVQELTLSLAKYSHMDHSARQLWKELK